MNPDCLRKKGISQAIRFKAGPPCGAAGQLRPVGRCKVPQVFCISGTAKGANKVEGFFTRWLKRKFVTSKAAGKEKDRTRYGLLEAGVSITGNVFLFILKLSVGVYIGSISVIADAFHTFSDLLSSAMVVVGFKIGGKAPDREHPHGHGRMETIAALVIAVLLLVTGLELIISSVERFFAPRVVGGGWWALIVMSFSALCKEWMAGFAFHLGKEIDSPALKADGWHHRNDAVTSLLVALGNIGVMRGWYWLDPLLGIAVAVLVIYTGWKLALSSGDKLLGVSPPQEMLDDIRFQAADVEGVKEVHDIQVHDYGSHRKISLHIEVSSCLDLVTAHQVADKVEKKLAAFLQAEVVVHVDPHTEKTRDQPLFPDQ